MADDFEKAILFSFDQSGAVDGALRAQAQALLGAARAAPDAWQLCLTRFQGSQYVEVRFWCIQALHELAAARHGELPPPARQQLRHALLAAGAAAPPLPSFLRNKVAQTLVALAAHEFPEEWPTFFQDLLGTLPSGPPAVDLFCRILVAVDEDIVSLEVPRSAEEARRSMAFKDAMRERALADIAEAWCQIVGTYHASSPETTAAVLATVQRYVHWIDIGLVANAKFLPLLFGVLSEQQAADGGDGGGAKGAAADVLTEVVGKRMEAVAKLALIQQLGVVPVCAGWAGGLPSVKEDPPLAAKLARLLAALATEVLEAWKKVENSVLSMAAVGLAVDAEAGSEANAACSTASSLLDALFPAVLAALRSGDDDVAAAVAPFLLSYVSRLRALQKRGGGQLPPEAAAHLLPMLEALACAARFADDSSAYEAVAASATQRVAAEEEESAVADRRQELFTLFKNAAKLEPSAAYSFVGGRLSRALSRRDAPWQDAELAITLLYQLGEGAAEADLKPGSGALAQLAAGVVQADVAAAKHRLVALALLEAYVRYARVLQQQGGELLPRVVERFLDERGMGHPSEAVARRAAYLLCRLAKQLRGSLRLLVPEILQRIHPHLSTIAATPSPEQQVGMKGAGAVVGRASAGTLTSAVDDRLYAFEAVGLLLGQEDLPAEEQHAWLGALLQPLVAQMEGNLEAAAAAGGGGDGGALDGSGSGGGRPPGVPRALLIQQALEAVARLSKGFNARLCTEARPPLGQLLVGALQAALAIPRRLPGSKPLRARFIAFLHRMVEALGPSILPYLPATLEVLLHSEADASDTADVLTLLNQLMQRFKGALGPLLQEMLPACVARVHSLLPADWDWSGAKALPLPVGSAAVAAAAGGGGEPGSGRAAAAGSTEELRERAELQRGYYSFAHSLTHSELSSVLLRSPPGTLDALLGALLRGAGTHVDVGMRKTCVQVFARLAAEWLGPPEALPGFRDYMIQQERTFGGSVLLEAMANSSIDVRDAAAISLLTEAAQSMQLLHAKCGEALLAHLCGAGGVLPRMGWPPEAQRQLALLVSQTDPKPLKDFLKAALQQSKATNGGGQPR